MSTWQILVVSLVLGLVGNYFCSGSPGAIAEREGRPLGEARLHFFLVALLFSIFAGVILCGVTALFR